MNLTDAEKLRLEHCSQWLAKHEQKQDDGKTTMLENWARVNIQELQLIISKRL